MRPPIPYRHFTMTVLLYVFFPTVTVILAFPFFNAVSLPALTFTVPIPPRLHYLQIYKAG
jgi:hypothetical protein